MAPTLSTFTLTCNWTWISMVCKSCITNCNCIQLLRLQYTLVAGTTCQELRKNQTLKRQATKLKEGSCMNEKLYHLRNVRSHRMAPCLSTPSLNHIVVIGLMTTVPPDAFISDLEQPSQHTVPSFVAGLKMLPFHR